LFRICSRAKAWQPKATKDNKREACPEALKMTQTL
jgi:hypothetical protein